MDLMMAGADRRHFAVLDGIRGVAAILVVARHDPWFFGRFDCPSSYLAVDIFFVLSGVVLCHAYEGRLRDGLSASRFLTIRLIRIYPLYALGSVIGLAVVLTTGRVVTGAEVLSAVLLMPYLGPSDIGLFPLDAPAWTLCLEAFASVAYGTFGWRLSDRRLLQLMAIAGMGLIAWIIRSPSQALDLGWSAQSFSGGVFRLVISFAFGVILYRLVVPHGHESRCCRPGLPAGCQTAASWTIIALVVLTLTMPRVGSQPVVDLGVIVIGWPALIFVALHLRPTGWSARVFRWLGAISFPLYAIHRPILDIVDATLSRFPDLRPGNHVAIASVGMMIGLLGLSALIEIAFDRPLRRRLSMIASGRRGAKPACGHVSRQPSKKADRFIKRLLTRRIVVPVRYDPLFRHDVEKTCGP